MRFLPTDQQDPLTRRQKRALVAGLSITQMIGWGTTFYLPSVLGGRIGPEIGASPEVLFGGVTVMLLISALLSPVIGHRIERQGSRDLMVIGALLMAAGLVLLALAIGPLTYLAAFVLFGLGVPLALSNAAMSAVAQGCPEDGRLPITVLMLVGGLSSGLFWPLTGWMEGQIGWRATVAVFAAVQALVCMPVFVMVVRRSPAAMHAAFGKEATTVQQQLPQEWRRRAFLWIVLGAGVSGLASWGLPLQLIPMFEQAGLPLASAIAIAALQSPASMAARSLDIALSRRVASVTLVTLASFGVPVTMLAMTMLLSPPISGTDMVLLGLCVASYGLCTALITAARSTMPLELFGAQGYAILLGRLMFWLNLVFACSPLLFSVVQRAGGAEAVLLTGFGLSVIAALAFWQLERLASRARAG